jgi:hypothetical protein
MENEIKQFSHAVIVGHDGREVRAEPAFAGVAEAAQEKTETR